jgi:hypothetical protein
VIIRDRIIRLFVDDPTPRGTRELTAALRDDDPRAVAKECLHLSSMGLLDAKRMDNWRHGKRYVFTPQTLLLSAGTLLVSNSTLLRIVKASTRPISNKEIRYAMSSLCDRKVTRREVQKALDTLMQQGEIALTGTSTKYRRRYHVRARDSAPWCRLASVTREWAAGRVSVERGARPVRQGRITRRSRETVS